MLTITSCNLEVTALITSFFHCKILLQKFFSKMKPNRVKQPKKMKHCLKHKMKCLKHKMFSPRNSRGCEIQ